MGNTNPNELKRVKFSPIVLFTFATVIFLLSVFVINHLAGSNKPKAISEKKERIKRDTQVVELVFKNYKLVIEVADKNSNLLTIFVGGTGKNNDSKTAKLIENLSDQLFAAKSVFVKIISREDNQLDTTTSSRAKSLLEIINYLHSFPDFREKTIILAGHSEGALVAVIACSQSILCKGIICLSMPGLSGENYALEKAKNQLITLGVNSNLTDEYVSFLKEQYDVSKSEIDEIELSEKIDNAQLNFSEKVNDKELIDLLKLQKPLLTSKWMRSFLRLEPTKYFCHLKCPVLLVYGQNDEFLDPKLNSKLLLSSLSMDQQKSTKVVILSNCDHILYPIKSDEADFNRPMITFKENISSWLQDYLTNH